MRKLPLIIILFSRLALGQAVDITDSAWVINSQAHIFENFKGHKSIYLQNGAMILPDVNFKNGIIEYDTYMTERVSFSGPVWRVQDALNYEEFYTRSHHSGHPDAFQYTPVYNGNAAWQLYHDLHTGTNDGLVGWRPLSTVNGFNAVIELPLDQWVHFKFIITDSQAEVYINHEEEPSIFIRDLLGPSGAGAIGLKSGAGATHFANFSYEKNENITLKSKGEPVYDTKPGTVMNWSISSGFNGAELAGQATVGKKFLNGLKWQGLEAERSGLVNINRALRRTQQENTVIAQFQVESDRARTVQLEFGFSDIATIYFDNKAIFTGNDMFRTRDYRYLGTIGFFDSVFLNLKKGTNTVNIAVYEAFGGWGVQARFVDMTGLSLK